MTLRSRMFRLFGAFAMLLQLVLPPALAVADGLLERDSRGVASVHIEDHSRASCRLAHSDDCALCRTLNHLSAPRGSAPCIPAVARVHSTDRDTFRRVIVADTWFGPPPSRAPPA